MQWTHQRLGFQGVRAPKECGVQGSRSKLVWGLMHSMSSTLLPFMASVSDDAPICISTKPSVASLPAAWCQRERALIKTRGWLLAMRLLIMPGFVTTQHTAARTDAEIFTMAFCSDFIPI